MKKIKLALSFLIQIWKQRSEISEFKNKFKGIYFFIEKSYIEFSNISLMLNPKQLSKYYYNWKAKEWYPHQDIHMANSLNASSAFLSLMYLKLKYKSQNEILEKDNLRIDFSIIPVGDAIFLHDVENLKKD